MLCRLAYVGEQGLVAGNAEAAVDVRLGGVQHLAPAVLGVDAEDVGMVPVLGEGIYLTVCPAPSRLLYAGVEVGGEASRLPGVEVGDVELVLYHAGRASLRQGVAYACQCLGASDEHHLLGVGRELCRVDEAVFPDKGVCLQCSGIYEQDGGEIEGTPRNVMPVDGDKQLRAGVGCAHTGAVYAQCQLPYDARTEIHQLDARAVPPPGLPVVGLQYLADGVVALLGTIGRLVDDKPRVVGIQPCLSGTVVLADAV